MFRAGGLLQRSFASEVEWKLEREAIVRSKPICTNTISFEFHWLFFICNCKLLAISWVVDSLCLCTCALYSLPESASAGLLEPGAQEYRTTARHDAVDHDSQPNLNPPMTCCPALVWRRPQTVHRLLHCTALRRRRRVDCSSDGSEICDRFMPGQLSRITRLQYV